MKHRTPVLAAFTAAAMSLAGLAQAETTFTVLGSSGGPNARGERGQPANLLRVNQTLTLVDAGDGVSEALAAKGVPLWSVDNLLISHLHFDHFGGLLAVLGLRFQLTANQPLQVYGPPGTEATVAGLLQGMKPAMEAAYGMEEAKVLTPEQLVQVHDVRDGDVIELGETTVTVAKNTHYSFVEGGEMDRKYQSLSFRFDTPDRSIVYTGDTGPSSAVAELARGADLLVSEVIDLDAVLANIRASRPNLTPELLKDIGGHLSTHHLTPAQVGELAATAGAKAVVLTHLVAGPTISEAQQQAWKDVIAAQFDGPVSVAQDLQDY